jgi:Fic family protein
LHKDQPIDEELVRDVHRRIVTGCDDDHCPPGQLRGRDENVTFGRPPHRGATGGAKCEKAFTDLCGTVSGEFRGYDALVQALVLQYQIGAIHPYHDGNGRTARALEALVLQHAQLKDDLFVSMSNYYDDEKTAYL